MEWTKYATTEHQKRVCEFYAKAASLAKTAKQFGISKSRTHKIVTAAKAKAAYHGVSPEHDLTHAVPQPHYLAGASTLYDYRENPEGDKVLQWVKTSVDKDQLKEFATEVAASIAEDITPRKPIKSPKSVQKDRLAVYPIGDAHIGLFGWEEDSQENYDLKIAEAVMLDGYRQVLDGTPDAEHALIINLGDWFHTDWDANTTKRSGHSLDVDTRWAKVIRVGVAIMRDMIEMALAKHKRVTVINEIGNHDDQTSVMLSLILDAYYRNQKRLTIDTSPDEFHWHEFGANLIGVHHGHKCKPERLYQVMSELKREECGRCQHRYWYCGHIHHGRRQDVGGQVIESFRTLIPRDKYAHSHGYTGIRDIQSIVHDRQFGQISRTIVNIDSIRGRVT